MKRFLRFLLSSLFLVFAWPFFIYRCYGNKKLRIQGKTIIISNHYSSLDAYFIYLKFGYAKIRFVTITSVKKNPVTRFITWLFDCLYIDYEATNLDFFKQCIKVLNGGGVICIYPEGAVNPAKYGFFDFQKSFVYFARKTGADILPVYTYPDLRPFKVTKLYIGDIYKPQDYEDYKDLYAAATFFQCKVIEYSNLVN